MALSPLERKRLWAVFMRLGNTQGEMACTKAELLAAIGGIDDGLDNVATTLNNSIPQPARNKLTANQKAMLVGYVAFARAGLVNLPPEVN